MKKILMLMFCVVMALALAGCGGSKEKEAASAGKVLKVATDANFPPFEFYQEQSKVHTGFDIALTKAVAKQMGYEKVEFVNVHFKDILTGLQDKKYDMAVAALSITPERARQVDFSEAYAEDGYKVIVNKNAQLGDDFAALAGKTVAAEEGSYAEELLKAQANGAKVIPVHDTEAGIKLVADGKADALVASKIVAGFFITHNYGDKVKFAGETVLHGDKYGMAVARDNQELQKKVNEALKEIKRSGEYKNIYSSYFGN
mgnify:CR=1 FL=1